jgi:hypothetical protein
MADREEYCYIEAKTDTTIDGSRTDDISRYTVKSRMPGLEDYITGTLNRNTGPYRDGIRHAIQWSISLDNPKENYTYNESGTVEPPSPDQRYAIACVSKAIMLLAKEEGSGLDISLLLEKPEQNGISIWFT